MSRALHLLLIVLSAAVAPALGQGLTPAQSERLAELSVKRVHGMNHTDLAEYVSLRSLERDAMSDPPAQAERILGIAKQFKGQTYKLNGQAFCPRSGDCMASLEMVLAVALCRTWEGAYRFTNRLRYKDGVVDSVNFNWFTEADWYENNRWLFDDATEQLGVETVPMRVSYNRRLAYNMRLEAKRQSGDWAATSGLPGQQFCDTRFIAVEHAEQAMPLLLDSDIIIIVTQRKDQRPACTHMGFLDRASDPLESTVLLSSAPAYEEIPLKKLLARTFVIGFKVLRLKELSDEAVAAELARVTGLAAVTPAQLEDRQALVEPDETVTIGGRQYGTRIIQEGDTMWGMFKSGWKAIYASAVNSRFRHDNPNPHRLRAGTVVYFPID